ncbi:MULTISPECIES: histidine kinase [unclassified Tenacibaculum]|uniref:histidine kinase n=1 Tax=unclassified Tenacibaculum TaxID=2635139 RepID=UPI001F1691F6|nr:MULTISPECIES: histidine kinase [unclassified Tenacibaculum]MCF2876642.1 histidine kinase [Tenacibaculum sp. Cn5-1]MCF2936793.1 histidine kinase [Tenacibaculum sp. Cn5-34]MCG7511760.1 histidine kinase [Tenacibaculum sp. Cn5-46]
MKRKIIIICCLIVISCKKTQEKVLPKSPSFFNNKIKRSIPKDSLELYLNLLKSIPKGNLSDSLKAEFYYTSGKYDIRLKEYDSAISNFNKATSFSESKIKSNREVLYFRALRQTYFTYKNDYLNGEGVNEKLLSLLDNKDYKNKAYVYYFKQIVKAKLKQFKEALIASDSATTMLLKVGDTTNYVMAKIGRSTILSSLNEQNKAIEELKKTLKYEDNLKTAARYELYGALGFYYYNNDLFHKGISAFEKALAFSKNLPSYLTKTRQANSYLNLSKSFIRLKKLDLAQKYIDSIYDLGIEDIGFTNQRSVLKTNLEILSKRGKGIDEVLAQLDSINDFQEKSYANRMNSELEALKKSHQKEIISEKAREEAEIKSLKLERNQYILTLLLLIAIVTGVLILNLYRQRRFKIEQQNFLLQQRLLRSQMNPHFTFNSLSLIKNTIEEDSEKSIRYIQKFSKLLRSIFQNSTKNYVPIEDELESLQNYIELQQFRFPERFDYRIENKIDTEDEILIPPMLLQPFVENAIIHGFRKSDSIGSLLIQLQLSKKYINCVIDDDGVGIDENNIDNRSSVKLIDEFLRKMTGKGIVILNKNTVAKKNKETGTRVELKIPYNIF